MKLHHITKLLAMLAGSYLIWSFIFWNFDPSQWNEVQRILLFGSVVLAYFFKWIYLSLDTSTIERDDLTEKYAHYFKPYTKLMDDELKPMIVPKRVKIVDDGSIIGEAAYYHNFAFEVINIWEEEQEYELDKLGRVPIKYCRPIYRQDSPPNPPHHDHNS